MFHAVSYALLDSINVLLIGVLFAVAVMHTRTGRFGRIAALLVAGDLSGVFLLAIVTYVVFGNVEDQVRHVLESPYFAMVLIGIGLLSAVLTFRGGDPTELINRLARPLQRPTLKTFTSGMALGAIQSITSVPFFAGLAYLTTTDLSMAGKLSALILYACLALSLPALSGLVLWLVLKNPESPLAQFIDSLRAQKQMLVRSAGYVVAAILILMGLSHFITG